MGFGAIAGSIAGSVLSSALAGKGERAGAAASAQATLPFSGSVEGLGGVTFDPGSREFTTTQSAQAQEQGTLFQNLFSQIGQQGLAGEGATQFGQNLIGQLGGFDIDTAAQERFAALDELQEQGRAERQAALEQRLFRQGRLDSTGGARQLQGQAEAEERARNLLAVESRTGALQEQQGLLSNALAAITGGSAATGGVLGQLAAAQAGQQQAAAAPLQAAQLGISAGSGAGAGQLQAARLTGQAGTAQANALAQVGSSLLGGIFNRPGATG